MASVSRQDVTGTLWCSFKCLRGHEWHHGSEAQSAKWNITHYTDGWQKVFGTILSCSLSLLTVESVCSLTLQQQQKHDWTMQTAASSRDCITVYLANISSNPKPSFAQSQLLILISLNFSARLCVSVCVCVLQRK